MKSEKRDPLDDPDLLDKYPLDELKPGHAEGFGEPAVLKPQRTFQEKEFMLIKELQEASESDEKDSFGDDPQVRSSGEDDMNNREEGSSHPPLQRMNAIGKKAINRYESPEASPVASGTGSSAFQFQ